MTLKEKFIEYFGEFKRIKKYFKTEEKYGLYLYYNYIKEEEHLPNDERKFSTLLIVDNNFSCFLNAFNEKMKLIDRDYKYCCFVKKVKIICEEIEIKTQIEKLEKQMLKETNHLPTAETKLQKF